MHLTSPSFRAGGSADPQLASADPAQPMPPLVLNWKHRRVDSLAYGVSLVNVTTSGGSDQNWAMLLAELQAASMTRAPRSGGFTFVGADRVAGCGRLEVGMWTTHVEAPLLEDRLTIALARANRATIARGAGSVEP